MIQRKFQIGRYSVALWIGRYCRLTTYKPTAYCKRISDQGPDFRPGWWLSLQVFRCYVDIDIRTPSEKDMPRIFTGSDGEHYSIHEARLLTPVERQTLFGYDPLAAMERSA